MRWPFLATIIFAVATLAAGLTFGNDIYRETADNIRATIESSLFTLPPDIQEHYAARMYRVTGDNEYLYPILYNLRIILDQFIADADHLYDSAYAQRRVDQLLDEFEGGSRKNRHRRKLFEDAGHMIFYLNLLHTCNKIHDYNIPANGIKSRCDSVIVLLRNIDFASFLTDSDVIRIYAAQAVNYVYYLYDLGIVDLRDRYRLAFRDVFPDANDDVMTGLEYKDKIYGLTHFIFAASGYYQEYIDSSDFKWILDYFSANIDRITGKTKEDIIVEVGICFCLAGRKDDPPAQKCRDAILSSVDRERAIIPSVSGDYSLEKGEHRNVLAVMLLSWPDDLHPGPSFKDRPEQYLKVFPERQ